MPVDVEIQVRIGVMNFVSQHQHFLGVFEKRISDAAHGIDGVDVFNRDAVIFNGVGIV
jgi:hypothetical protein